MYTVYFYKNYPFSATGRRVYTPQSDSDRESFLAAYLIRGVEVNSPFFESQDHIHAAYASDIAAANYIKVVTAFETRFYYVSNVAIIEGYENEGATLEFTLVEDVWQTKFFKFEGGARTTTITHADIINTNFPSFFNNPTPPRALEYHSIKTVSEITDPTRPSQLSVTPFYAEDTPHTVVMFCARPDGRVFTFTVQCNTRLAALEESETLASVAQYSWKLGGGARVNISVNKMYIVPTKWLYRTSEGAWDAGWQLITDNNIINLYTADEAGNVSENVREGGTFVYGRLSGVHAVDTFLLPSNQTTTTLSGETHTFLRKMSILTASKEIPLTPLRETDEDVTANISICVDQTAANFSIFLTVYGQRYDITADFAADFAINHKRAARVYAGDSNVLSDVSAAVSALGGVVGGVASGNYFGGVQSVVGGVGYFVNREAELKTPASISFASNAEAAVRAYGGIGILDYGTPENWVEISKAIKYEGYNNRYYADIVPKTLQNAALRVLSAEVRGVDESAAEYIITRLQSGVYFSNGTD